MPKEFDIDDGILEEYLGSGGHVVIPDGVREIAEGAFDSCESLVRVTLPDTVTTIGIMAFAGCENLERADLPASVTEIETMAFDGCKSLRSVAIPEKLTVIEKRAFYCCESLTLVTIPEGVARIRRFAFSECTGLKTVVLPESVTDIEEFAFMNSLDVTFVCPEGSYAHQYCQDNALPFLFDYQYEAFRGLIPQGFEKLASPFLADEEKPYIFISYSHKDRDRVLPLIKDLYESGWKIWYDEGLTIGDRYDQTLESHVENCSAFLLFVSDNSRNSFYCRENEIPWAAAYGRPIIKCVLEEEADFEIREGTVLETVRPRDIGKALEKAAGLSRGGRRTAKGVSVVVSPEDRDEPDLGTFAFCLYSGKGTAAARAIMLEARDNGCLLYDGTGDPEDDEKRKESSCLIVFLDKAFLSDDRLTGILTEAFQTNKDMAVCQLEELDETDLPRDLAGLSRMQWLNYAHGISADMNTKLARHLQKRGCRKTGVLPGFEYETRPDGIVIRRYTGKDPEPRIESEYGGLPVVEIGKGAFKNCVHLRSLVLPEGILKIGQEAFEGCVNLTSVQMPGGLTEISIDTFAHCRSLTSVTIPDPVREIGSRAFQDCRSLTFLKIPAGVRKIGESAFAGCASLRSIDLPDGLTGLNDSLFSGCESLTSFTIPEGVKRIEAWMFHNCTRLASVSIPDSVTMLGWGAFAGCRSLTSILLPRRLEGIASRCFEDCESLTRVTVPRGTEGIGDKAFHRCRNLKALSVPSSVRIVEATAFLNCPSLTILCPSGSIIERVCRESGLPYAVT